MEVVLLVVVVVVVLVKRLLLVGTQMETRGKGKGGWEKEKWRVGWIGSAC